MGDRRAGRGALAHGGAHDARRLAEGGEEFFAEKEALEQACALYGLTGGRLARRASLGELEEAYCQVSAVAGRPMNRRGFSAAKELVGAAVAFYPVAKRLHGE